MIEAPKFDKRTAADIAVRVPALLRQRRLAPDRAGGRFDAALIQVFARFTELVIERLNKAPEKNFIAFLDLLGVSPLPMEAARLPLTFYLAPGNRSHAKVQAGTRVAAPADKLSKKPVIFETESDLDVTSTQLGSLFIKDGTRDQYCDLSTALLPDNGSQAPATASLPEAPTPTLNHIPHTLNIAVPLNPAWPSLDQLRLHFVLDGPEVSPRSVQWEIRAVPAAVPAGTAASAQGPLVKILTPDSDTTKNLTQGGDVVFKNLPQPASFALDGVSASWLTCSLLTPMTAEQEPGDGTARQSQGTVIKELSAEVQLARVNLALDHAFQNAQKLDLTKDFFPFGERPKVGDAFYLATREAFSDPDALITLNVQLTNPEGQASGGGIPPAKGRDVQLAWEVWDGKTWADLRRHLRIGDAADDAVDTEFSDGTQSLTRNGKVSFRLGRPPAELNLNGQKNYWVRVRIEAGDYGRELQYQKNEATGGFTITPATLAPPSIRSLKVDYVVKKESKPRCLLYNDFEYAQVDPGSPFRPFIPVKSDNLPPALYFGFKTPAVNPTGPSAKEESARRTPQGEFPRFPVSAYVLLDHRSARGRWVLTDDRAAVTDQAAATWEYWDGLEWKKFAVADSTQGIRRSGLVQFLVPGVCALRDEFGKQRYWLRMRLNSGDELPPIRCILLNTTTAVQGLTVLNDILGSSNGEPRQKFKTTQPSVLTGQTLEIREPTKPADREEQELRAHAAEGEDPIRLTNETPGKTEYWVTWREVPNFYGSSARDRHYVIDRTKDEIIFGDGVCGLIPPVLPGNVRLRRYRSGGGSAGNQPAQVVKQLVSAVPYIQKVVNWTAASGGSDTEPANAMLDRGPRGLRHRGRAVTVEDFEDLARLASREVARAKCVPQFDLISDVDEKRRRPGVVSVIVVPRSDESKPVPSSDLLDRVRAFLDARRLATADLVVRGPEFVRVDVAAEVVVDQVDNASEVEEKVTHALKTYLHPIRGGPNGSGWDFGRLPQKSDLYVLIERIAGVSHIRSVSMSMTGDRSGAEKTGHFLIYCGRHRITLSLQEQRAN